MKQKAKLGAREVLELGYRHRGPALGASEKAKEKVAHYTIMFGGAGLAGAGAMLLLDKDSSDVERLAGAAIGVTGAFVFLRLLGVV